MWCHLPYEPSIPLILPAPLPILPPASSAAFKVLHQFDLEAVPSRQTQFHIFQINVFTKFKGIPLAGCGGTGEEKGTLANGDIF